MTRMKLLGFLMAGLALVACGDDEVGDGGETGSELDGKQLGSLTPEEADEVCDELRGQSEAISKEDMCELAGVFASGFGMECETTKQECISAPEEPEEPDTCGASQFTRCTATVAEARACVASIANAFRSITCESAPEDIQDLGQTAECAVMEEKCPGSIEGEGEETEGAGP